ncbi:uncharacterized protein LOC143238228 isoform X2 [Tachypleus tridentatus]|uniref:uncharacterized protein LOC143238228 isoform X2 n=1 Tax=Tachypleus tridentatus TaxID=6853 RepID=UPI003FD5FCD0
MSYPQFGYSYPPSSQFLVPSQTSPGSCCDSVQSGAADPHNAVSAAVYSLPPACDSRILPSYPRLASSITMNGLFGTAYPDPTSCVTALGPNAPAFYTPLATAEDLKDRCPPWGALTQGPPCYTYDATFAAYNPYNDRYGSPMDNVARRKNATRETTNTLKAWLYEHRKNPYPTKGEKIMLAIITKMTLTQVSTWFANARRRLKKENKMTWEPKNKQNDAEEIEEVNNDSVSADEIVCKDVKTKENRNKSENKSNVDRVSTPPLSLNKDPEDRPTKDKTEEENYNSTFREILDHSSPQNLSLENKQFALPSASRTYHQHIPSPGSTACQNMASPGSPNSRPKIWSLAHTATSDSPPALKRPPQYMPDNPQTLKYPHRAMLESPLTMKCSSQLNSDSSTSLKSSNQTMPTGVSLIEKSTSLESCNPLTSNMKERCYKFDMAEGFVTNNGLVSNYADHWHPSPDSKTSSPTKADSTLNFEGTRVLRAPGDVVLPCTSTRQPSFSLSSTFRENGVIRSKFPENTVSLTSNDSYEYRLPRENTLNTKDSKLYLSHFKEVMCPAMADVRHQDMESQIFEGENFEKSSNDNIEVIFSLSKTVEMWMSNTAVVIPAKQMFVNQSLSSHFPCWQRKTLFSSSV